MGVQVDVVITLLVAVLLIFFLFRETRKVSNYNETTLPKIIWILWLQGWDKAPYIARKVRESWEKHNPGWEVRAISKDNLDDYVNISYLDNLEMPVNQSDVIRLHLLAKHGGVWADATMLCMRPLDDWVHDMIKPSSVWMYHGRENCETLASWFIISKKDSYMMNAWKEKCDIFWSDGKKTADWHFMDALWKEVYIVDSKFREEWSRVPKICCEDRGQAHMLAGKVNEKDPDLQEIIRTNPPHAIKLSHHGFVEDDTESNGNRAIFFSLSKFNEGGGANSNSNSLNSSSV